MVLWRREQLARAFAPHRAPEKTTGAKIIISNDGAANRFCQTPIVDAGASVLGPRHDEVRAFQKQLTL